MAFKWTEPKRLAVRLLAEDEKTDEQIAAVCGVSRPGLAKWKNDPEFSAALNAAVEAYAHRILSRGIARRERRMAILDDLATRHLKLIEERAAEGVDHYGKPVAGGSTGLIVRQGTPTKAGVMYEYANDVGTTKELRETLKQAAQEAGEWEERVAVSGGITQQVSVHYDYDSDPDGYRSALAGYFRRERAGLPDLAPNGAGEPVDSA